MAGMIGLGPTDSTSAQAMGTDLVPAGAGEVLGSTFAGGLSENITTRLFRTLGREGGAASVDFPAVDAMGNPLGYSEHADIPGDPILPAEDLNKQYGIKGVLSFDKPGTAAAAEALQKHKREQLAVADTLARSDGSLLASAPIRFATSLAAGLLDPLNVAAAFIPVVGEARAAVMLEQAGGAFGRAAVRAGIGAAEGAVGMAALEPLSYALDVAEHNDWTMAKALQNIAFGGVLGGGLHMGAGAVRDLIRRPARPVLDAVADRMEAAGPAARETALRGGIAAVVEGRGVDVAPAVELIEARQAMAQPRERAPVSLLEFLARRGGVVDDGGDLAAMGADTWHRGRVGMPRLLRAVDETPEGQGALGGVGGGDGVRATTHDLDSSARAAWEAGYLPGADRPDTNALLAAIDRELRGERAFTADDMARAEARANVLRQVADDDRTQGIREEVQIVADDGGIRLTPAEIDHATRMVSDGASPAQAVHEAMNASAIEAVEAANRAATNLRDAARRDPMAPDDAAGIREVTEQAARKQPTTTELELADVQQRVADLQQAITREREAGRLPEAAEAQLKQAERMADELEGNARAFDAAAACMVTRA